MPPKTIRPSTRAVRAPRSAVVVAEEKSPAPLGGLLRDVAAEPRLETLQRAAEGLRGEDALFDGPRPGRASDAQKGTSSEPQAYHFVGVGGIGMSAIARILLARGEAVTGSDVKATRLGRRAAARRR